jgi:myo-inositol-1(or 4)-monophosphatase
MVRARGPEAPEPRALLRIATRLAVDAGRLLRDRPADLHATSKSTPTDAVTAMDGASERLILAGLARLRPGDPVVAEESGARAGEGPVTWHVDPLDGTVNYLYDRRDWAVSIAAVADGRTVAAAVYDAGERLLYTATIDGPATCNGRVLRCREPASLGEALVATGFSYDAGERAAQATLLAGVLPRVRDIRRAGSAALDLCAVASGAVDAYYEEGAHSWDWLAGELIAVRAGAAVARSAAGVTGRPGLAVAAGAVLPPLLTLLNAGGAALAEASAMPGKPFD